jgi:hypothetical protein
MDLGATRMLLTAGADPNAKYAYVRTEVGQPLIHDQNHTPMTVIEHLRALLPNSPDAFQKCLDMLEAPPPVLTREEFAAEHGLVVPYAPCCCTPEFTKFAIEEDEFMVQYLKKHGLTRDQCVTNAKEYHQEFREWLKKKANTNT